MPLERTIVLGNAMDPDNCVEIKVPGIFKPREVIEQLRLRLATALEEGGRDQAAKDVTGLGGEPGAFCLAVAVDGHFGVLDRQYERLEKRVRESEGQIKELKEEIRKLRANGADEEEAVAEPASGKDT